MENCIVIKGAKEHNLKNVDIVIPKNKLIVFTGISGSGKSSMAFDTIYAEGQRRYVESLSSYARQFLGIMNKPDVDSITGLQPSISIDQKSRSANPRSTVGTITEIYDYLRLLYSKIGRPYCPNCSIPISKLTIDEIVELIIFYIKNKTDSENINLLSIQSPIVRNKKGEFSSLIENIFSKGYTAILVDGKKITSPTEITLIKTNFHNITVIIDIIQYSKKQIKQKEFLNILKKRLFDAIEQATILSSGLAIVEYNKSKSNLYSTNLSCPKCGYSIEALEPRMFSFNSIIGACEKCHGLGFIPTLDPKRLFNPRLSITEGGIPIFHRLLLNDTWFARIFFTFCKKNNIPINLPLSELTEKQIDLILNGSPEILTVRGRNRENQLTTIYESFKGISQEIMKRYTETQSEYTKSEIEKYINEVICPVCKGKRLNKKSLSVKIQNYSIFDICDNTITDLRNIFISLEKKLTNYEKEISKLIIKEIANRLDFLENVGLGYLTLNRSARSLSGGESQRIRLASQIGSGLSGVLYVLDEPSIGLHPKDVKTLISSLKTLVSLGNTVIVVEHDVSIINSADYIVDFGPLAGKNGGKIVFSGKVKDLLFSNTITAQYLNKKICNKEIIKHTKKEIFAKEYLVIKNCSQHNLKNITARFPIGYLTCVTGVSGSGKSTLVVDTLYAALHYQLSGHHKGIIGEHDSILGFEHFDRVYLVDQSPIGRTPRSNPATYIGVFDAIRDVFSNSFDAKLKGYKKSRFSFNVKGGRCEKCQGAGSIKIEMQFLPDMYVECDVCKGKRYNSETLEVMYKNKSIYDVLSLTVDEAFKFFSNNEIIRKKLSILKDVGLSYLELGQPATTLSGGEAQRIKLASELSKKSNGRTLYILDEPTTGLHLYDIEKLLITLYRLVEKGNTVIVIEHNLDVIKNSQYIIDLGPDGGENGGYIVYQGPLKGIYNIKNSYTAKYLNKTSQC